MTVIDEVKQKTDIVEVISQYTTLTKAGRTFRALCPFHSEKRPSFFVYPEQQSWHCFGACNTGGDVFSFVMKKQGIDFGEALRLLAQRAGVTIPSRSAQDTGKDERERLYQVNEAAAQYFHNLLLNSKAGEKARKYLASRGLSPKTIADFQLGFSLNSWEALKQYLMERGYTESELLEAGLVVETEEGKTHDRFRNRLLFPINDARGHTTGFGARVLDPSAEGLPKYLNSPQTPVFDKSSSLYGINLAAPAIRQQNLAVIVEGYTDVITAHQNGFNNVVASMGTALTMAPFPDKHKEDEKQQNRQLNIIKRLTTNMILALDADEAGEEAMLRCVEYENILDAEVRVAILPAGKDPDDVIREDTQAWQDLLAKALPVIDYSFNMATSKLDMTTAKGKSQATNQLLPILARMKNDIRLDHYLTRLSKLTGISYNKLETVLKGLITRPKAKKPAEKREAPTLQSVRSSPLEEYCLALLLQHPELKRRSETLLPEYFENSENREIFIAWQQTDDLSSLEGKLDTAIHGHLNYLINKSLPPTSTDVDQRYADYVRSLGERFFKNFEAKRADKFALEAELRGAGADLAKLEEEGIEPSIQLGELFAQKARRGQGKGDKK